MELRRNDLRSYSGLPSSDPYPCLLTCTFSDHWGLLLNLQVAVVSQRPPLLHWSLQRAEYTQSQVKYHISTYTTTIPGLRRSRRTQKSINFCWKANQSNTALPDYLFMSFPHAQKTTHTHTQHPWGQQIWTWHPRGPFHTEEKGNWNNQQTARSWCFHKISSSSN